MKKQYLAQLITVAFLLTTILQSGCSPVETEVYHLGREDTSWVSNSLSFLIEKGSYRDTVNFNRVNTDDYYDYEMSFNSINSTIPENLFQGQRIYFVRSDSVDTIWRTSHIEFEILRADTNVIYLNRHYQYGFHNNTLVAEFNINRFNPSRTTNLRPSIIDSLYINSRHSVNDRNWTGLLYKDIRISLL